MNALQHEARIAALQRIASCRLVLDVSSHGVTLSMLESCPGGERVLASRTVATWVDASVLYTSTYAAMHAARVEVQS